LDKTEKKIMYTYAKKRIKAANTVDFDNTHPFDPVHSVALNKTSMSSFGEKSNRILIRPHVGYCIKKDRIVKVYHAKGKGKQRFYYDKTKVPKNQVCYKTLAKAKTAYYSKPRKGSRRRSGSFYYRKPRLGRVVILPLRKVARKIIPAKTKIIKLHRHAEKLKNYYSGGSGSSGSSNKCSHKSASECMASPNCSWTGTSCKTSGFGFGMPSNAKNYQLFQQATNAGTPTKKQLYTVGDGHFYVAEDNLSGYGFE